MLIITVLEMSIWDSLSTSAAPSGNAETALAIMTPEQMVSYDMNAQELVRADTEALKGSLAFSERIVIAAYTVADYVPDLDNDQYAKFWKEQVSLIILEVSTKSQTCNSFPRTRCVSKIYGHLADFTEFFVLEHRRNLMNFADL
jgi:hypothetical protein